MPTMNQQRNIVKIAKIHDVSSTLKELDRQICASWPNELTAHTALKLLDAHGQLIADTLETVGDGQIQTVAHAAFHDFSRIPAHREAARRWFVEHKQEAKKARFVFDRFDGLGRLKRLKEVLSGLETVPPQNAAPAAEPDNDSSMTLPPEALEFLFVQPEIYRKCHPAVRQPVPRLGAGPPHFFFA